MDSPSRGPPRSLPPPIAGVKRPALLPAFEPESSPPSLPRAAKRLARSSPDDDSLPQYVPAKYVEPKSKYPTPVPTSSTGILTSSSPTHEGIRSRRPGLQRSISALSERVPLGSVPIVVLDAGGEPTFMGRSGKSSHHQLSTNKLISRVHIQAVYIPANPPKYAKVQVECTGWNGAKIHCQGRAWELAKGDSFTSDKPDADIMIDVQDARVLLKWPKVKMQSLLESDSDETSENSPRRGVMNARSPFSSPLKERARLRSPVSPSPIRQRTTQPSLLDTGSSLVLPAVQIYEDDPSENEAPAPATTQLTQSTQHLTQPLGARQGDGSKLGSPLAHDVNDYYGEDDENENGSNENEENDPIIDSFYGENSIQSRMASFNTNASPLPNARSVLGEKSPQNAHLKVESTIGEKSSRAITNHVINQLAYSRLSSTPLSDIMKNLPSELKDVISSGSTKTSRLSTSSLKYLLHKTACVGEVQREGKDAAGKALESEFYYIPDADEDHERRDTVVDSLRKPGLRACRKQHKQYYWRKPK